MQATRLSTAGRRILLAGLVPAFPLLLLSPPAKAGPAAGVADQDLRDRVTLRNGRTLKGRETQELDDRICLLVGTRERWIRRKLVREIQSVARSMVDLLLRYRKESPRRPAELWPFVDFCRKHRLSHEEKLFCRRILLADSKHDQANMRLGHLKRGDHWLVPVKSQWVPLEQACRIHRDWGKAWEIRSEHFAVRSCSSLKLAMDTLFELEYMYLYFYILYQKPLELRELVEPVRVFLFKDRKQYPSAGTHVGAYFSGAENILYTYIGNNKRPFALFHEATHGLIHNVAVHTTRTRGKFPSWLDEAWAVYMENLVVPTGRGIVNLRQGRTGGNMMRVVATARKPYKVHRILNFTSSDYGASSKQTLKYAQGFVLFHYLMHGADGAYRSRFTDYIKQALGGKGQASTFRRIFRKDLQRIERGYIAHARSG